MHLEYGYNGDFKARALTAAHAVTLSLNYSPTSSLVVEFAHDDLAAQTPTGAPFSIGIGNM